MSGSGKGKRQRPFCRNCLSARGSSPLHCAIAGLQRARVVAGEEGDAAARSCMPSLYASQAPSTCSHGARWRYLRVWVVQIGCGYRPLRNFPALSFCLCLLGACSQSLHVRASATNGGVATHPAARAARCGKGCNKEHAHWLSCPKGCCCKRQHLPCCQCLPGRQPVFCFVLRALRLAATAFAQQGTRYEAFEQTLTPCGAAATA